MNLLRAAAPALLILHAGCSSPDRSSTDGPPPGLVQSARELYEAYGTDLRAHNRATLSQYYDPNGAIIIVSGRRQFLSRAALDTFYRGDWPPPAYFAWDSLVFDSLTPEMVVVTGGFRWLVQGTSDTGRYIYASILQSVDSGLAIRLEHETPAPKIP